MLPKMDGFELAKKIRENNNSIPIIFLTAKSMLDDKIEGLTIGGDDYIIKLDFQLSKVTQITGISQNVMTTWPELITDFLKNESFGGYIKKSSDIATKQFYLKSFTTKTPQEKFDSIMTLVKNNFSWNKTNSKFASKSPKNFLKDKY